MLLYIWKKPNDEFVCRLKKDYIPILKIGEQNSFGWTLVSIQCVYNYRFYDYKKIYNLKLKQSKKKKKKYNFIKFLNNQLLSGILYLLVFFFLYIVMRLIYRIFNWLIP